MKQFNLFIALSFLVFFSACDSSSSAAVHSENKVASLPNITMKNAAWMREKLPEKTFAYARIPTIWQLFFEAKGDALHPAQDLDQNKNTLTQFQQGLVDIYNPFIPEQGQLLFKTLAQNMTSPLEMAVIQATDDSMIPNALFATTLKNTSLKELNALMNTLIQSVGPQMKVLKPFDASGQASYMAAMVPIVADYDSKTGRLALFSGLTATQKGLQNMLAQSKHDSALDSIMDFENSVDHSGKNIEVWVNIKAVYQQNNGFIPPPAQELIKQMGVDQMNFVWIGSASKNGKSEFIVHLAMPDVGFRQFMPRVDSTFNVKTAGNPRSVWQLALPSLDQVIQGFELAISFDENPSEIRQGAMEIVQKIDDFLTVPLSDVYAAYGQKLLIVTDDSGTWYATKIIDMQAHKKIFDKLSLAFKTQTSQKSLAGVQINQSIFSTLEFEKAIMGDDNDTPAIFKKLEGKQYSFYQIEGDYVIQAFTPQVLADRSNSRNKIELNHWLDQQQVNWDHSILAYSKEIRDAPRDIYHSYLLALMFTSGLVNVEMDLFSFPTAQQLKLPKTGRFGFAFDSSSDSMTLRLSYEYSILESMSIANTYMSLAVIGIMGAYAIPAYRDYTVRAHVAGAIMTRYKLQVEIGEYYFKNNAFPKSEYFSNLHPNSEWDYDANTGEITLHFTHNSPNELSSLAGKYIKSTPDVIDDEYIHWQCTGSVPEAQLPLDCYYVYE